MRGRTPLKPGQSDKQREALKALYGSSKPKPAPVKQDKPA